MSDAELPVLDPETGSLSWEAPNAETGGGEAWCEAVLQRDSGYLDSSNKSWENENEDSLSAS